MTFWPKLPESPLFYGQKWQLWPNPRKPEEVVFLVFLEEMSKSGVFPGFYWFSSWPVLTSSSSLVGTFWRWPLFDTFWSLLDTTFWPSKNLRFSCFYWFILVKTPEEMTTLGADNSKNHENDQNGRNSRKVVKMVENRGPKSDQNRASLMGNSLTT